MTRDPRTHSPDLAGVGGFTLLEMLVALFIFSLLLGTAAYTLRMAGPLLQKTEQRYAKETRLLSRLRDSIASTYYYVGERRAMSLNNKEYYYHFFGGGREIDYISSRPINCKGLALTRLHYQGRYLLLEETPVYNLRSDFKEPVMPVDSPDPLVLMNDLESFRIEYLNNGQWSASMEETLPDGVRILYKKANVPEARELYVRIKSDYSDKKDFMEALTPSTRGL